jgi:hypothetical protein
MSADEEQRLAAMMAAQGGKVKIFDRNGPDSCGEESSRNDTLSRGQGGPSQEDMEAQEEAKRCDWGKMRHCDRGRSHGLHCHAPRQILGTLGASQCLTVSLWIRAK